MMAVIVELSSFSCNLDLLNLRNFLALGLQWWCLWGVTYGVFPSFQYFRPGWKVWLHHAVFADFHQTFSLYFVVFSHKTLFISKPTIKQGAIVSRNFLKITGTAMEPNIRKKFLPANNARNMLRKTNFLAFSQDFITSFFWFFVQSCLLECPKHGSPIFENLFFWLKMLFLIFHCFLIQNIINIETHYQEQCNCQ